MTRGGIADRLPMAGPCLEPGMRPAVGGAEQVGRDMPLVDQKLLRVLHVDAEAWVAGTADQERRISTTNAPA